jgi:hypothetical protein
MFDHRHYIPILKGREGEYGALQMLQDRNGLTPLLEVPPIPWDYEEERPAKTIDKHLEKVAQKIQRSWGPDRTILLDLLWISESERMDDGRHPIQYVFDSGRNLGIRLLPVIGLLKGDEYLDACREAEQQDHRGVCIRVQREDFADFADVAEPIGRILDGIKVPPSESHFILDLRALTPSERDVSAAEVIELINRIPMLVSWRSFSLAATSFPQNLMGLPPSDSSLLPRTEWTLWQQIWRNRGSIPRVPAYADYAISHPEPAEVDPRVVRPSASVRYTCADAWLILKARNLKDHGYEQFHEVCRDLIKAAQYSGRSFSWGDTYIDDCAAKRVGTGNLTTWRKVGTSHHLVFVPRQLASVFGS